VFDIGGQTGNASLQNMRLGANNGITSNPEVIGSSAARGPLLRSFQADTISIQNIPQGYDAFQFVHVSTANNWQGVRLSRAQTLQCKMKRLVPVDVRKIT
jgi:hypothetical protein